MYTIISPAKKMDFSEEKIVLPATEPFFPEHTVQLIERTRRYSKEGLKSLMSISDKLASLNADRFKNFDLLGEANTKQAALAFAGDVYSGLKANTLDKESMAFAQKNIGILSGLYGLLRPLDKIQPYRLEMGSKVNTDKGKNLYEFWGTNITKALNNLIKNTHTKVLINLSSNEYYTAIKPDKLDYPVIQPIFKERKNGKLKIISFSAKKARGLMVRFIIDNKINQPEELKKFNIERYKFCGPVSNDKSWVFSRENQEN